MSKLAVARESDFSEGRAGDVQGHTVGAGSVHNEVSPDLAVKDVQMRRWRWLILLIALAGIGISVGYMRWAGFARRSPDDVYASGLSAFQNEDPEGLKRAIAALAHAEDHRPHRALLTGMYYLRTGEPHRALNVLSRAAESAQTQELAFVCGGEALYRLGRLDDAVVALTSALRVNAESADAHRWLASIYYDLGTMDKALYHLERITAAAPDDPRPYRLRGLILKDFERYTEAIAAYRDALDRTDDDEFTSEIYTELAECEVKLLKFDDALKDLRRCPDSSQVLALRAECYYANGDMRTAETAVERALQLDPHNLEALFLSANIALDQQRPIDALKSLQIAVGMAPEDHRIHMKLAQAYRLLGRGEEADDQMALMQKYRDLRTQFTELHMKAMDDTSNADLRYQLGQVALQLGKPLLAERWFQTALMLDPNHQPAQTELRKLRAAKQADDPAGAAARNGL